MCKLISGMNWYVAKIIYQVISGNGMHTPQFDEQYRLIRADELSWAWEKAQVLGRLGQLSFENNTHETVQWKFINVADVCEISELEDGAQLYSHTEEPGDVEEYISMTHARAQRFMQISAPEKQSMTSENFRLNWIQIHTAQNLN